MSFIKHGPRLLYCLAVMQTPRPSCRPSTSTLEIKAALFDANIKKEIPDYIFGLGGREIRLDDIESIYNDLGEMINGKSKPKVTYLGVRE